MQSPSHQKSQKREVGEELDVNIDVETLATKWHELVKLGMSIGVYEYQMNKLDLINAINNKLQKLKDELLTKI